MGIIRTLLAVIVVFGHSPWLDGKIFVGGRNAVQIFYIISGFLMSHILVTMNKYPNPGAFYLNRWLRLYPLYFIVAGLSLIFACVQGSSEFLDTYRNSPVSADIALGLVNLTLFGQDWIMFAGVKGGHLQFMTDYKTSDVLLYHGLLVVQAWTLGVELSFYLIAPFILRRRKIIWGLLGLSILVRGFLFYIGLGTHDPWTYRFFPAELAYFLFGALSNQLLLPLWKSKVQSKNAAWLPPAATGFLVFLILIYRLLPMSEIVRSTALAGTFIILMPLAFLYQSSSRFDKHIGELSYPVYIGHMLVIGVYASLLGDIRPSQPWFISVTNVLLALMFAALLNNFIAKKIEIVRDRISHAALQVKAGSFLREKFMK